MSFSAVVSRKTTEATIARTLPSDSPSESTLATDDSEDESEDFSVRLAELGLRYRRLDVTPKALLQSVSSS